ncbi:MAG: class I tRNA ligase family protein, partial [Betaproteobacteria bacterium AqS2]|nr:class I tRNA ligase family protein [Betaproteobacteria bacterium AqS2]
MSKQSAALAPSYDPAAIEREVYAAWEKAGLFASAPEEGREAFCILLPPPNVTGTLHMGHAFQHAVMDAYARAERMRGKNVLWQPGTDHAGVGTHIVVSRALRREGLDPETMDRGEFLARVREWKEGSASAIGVQMRRLGDSCDWARDCFTLDPGPSAVVREAFVRLHEEGLVYRGKRLVNWDPKLLTALADLEVTSAEEEGVMHHVRYPFADGDGDGVVIATTRPETILVDGAVAVAPDDPRHQKLVGRMVRVPCTERTIPVIADEHVDASFGSGCVKITPAHDFNDYEVAQRHPEIPVIELMTPAAVLNDNAPAAYRGLDRYAAREKIIADLKDQGLLVKSEPHRYQLPRGERSGVVVEPMLSDQWFLRMAPLAERALAARRGGRVEFVPPLWGGVYDRWLENIKDWCISRQIDWGHPIPAWRD